MEHCLQTRWRQNLLSRQVVFVCACWGGGVYLIACMDRSVIQTAHTVSPLWSCLWSPLGQGGVTAGLLNKNTCCTQEVGPRGEKMTTVWPRVYEWSVLTFPHPFLSPDFFLSVMIHLDSDWVCPGLISEVCPQLNYTRTSLPGDIIKFSQIQSDSLKANSRLWCLAAW